MSVLVVSWDRIGERIAGSAARALELARALARSGIDPVLAAPAGSALDAGAGVRLVEFASQSELARRIDESEAVVLSGRIELMTAVKTPLVVDLYDPFILSNLDLFGADFNRSRGRALLSLGWLRHHLANGDFFLCASESQRAFWLGMLASAGRVNRANYDADAELRALIDIVPFGVPDEPPVAGPPVVKGVIPGIEPSDRVVLWAGGMWNWVDPLTLIRAAALLRDRRPDVKTLILGARHPNEQIGEMAMATEARALAAELGLREAGVWFIDWVPYGDRQRYLLESDVGVSLHRRGIESEFAFRTRILDFVWSLRPMVVTAGDDLAARVAAESLGRVVPPDDPEAVAAAIEAVLDEPDRAGREARLRAARESLAWSRAVEPLRRFCAAPRRAPDRAGDAWFAADTTREEMPRKEDALIADEFVTDARAISEGLGKRYAPRQRFRAAYDDLAQIDVLLWVEPPVIGWNLVFELFYADAPESTVARVVAPATALPLCDWQRFEFRPLRGSRGRELELSLSLEEADPLPDGGAGAGRVCVWRCARAEGGEEIPQDAGLAFIARYLVADVAEQVPASPDSFLFLHGTTIPLRAGADPELPLLASGEAGEARVGLEPTGGATANGSLAAPPSAAVDVERLRADLARVSAQSAAAERRVALLAREIDRRVAAEVEVRLAEHGAGGLTRRALRAAALLPRIAVRLASLALVGALAVLTVPLALAVGAALAGCDLLALAAGRRRAARAAARAEAGARTAVDAASAVSVVIPTWNGRELLEMSLPPLLAAIRRHGNPADEIVVVDNGSDDATVAWLEDQGARAPELRWIALDRNHGFAGATNRGAAEAHNPALILLNNDMVVEPDFVQPLLDAFAEEPRAFGVSCQIDFIDPTKPRWETGKVHGELRSGRTHIFHLDRFDEDLLYPIFFAGGGASAYDRARFLELGGFDEAVFSPVYIEDVDLGYRAWKRGWPALLAPRSRVHHKHRGTTRRLWSEARIHSFFRKNLTALLWKNASSWRLLGRHLLLLPGLPGEVRREQGPRSAMATFLGLARQIPTVVRARWREAALPRALSDEDIFHLSRYRHAYQARFHPEQRDPSGRPQVLVVSPYSPVPAVHGGAVRMQSLIRELRERCDVTLVSFADTEAELAPESLAELRRLCRDVVLVPRAGAGGGGALAPGNTWGFYSRTMFDQVEAWLDRRRFDVVQVEYTHMAHYLPPRCPGLMRVLVEHDVAFVALRRARASAPSRRRRLELWIDGLRTLRHEVAAVESADLVLTMSADDREALARFVDPATIEVVPNGVSCRDFPPRSDAAEPSTILFVGFFRHEPNVEAVLYFAREVLPRVRARVPGALFRVVGAYPPEVVQELGHADPAIEVTGLVPETASHYRRATVFVAPILRGSGTRLKILEAMASGCAVVSTTIGAEGLDAPADAIALADDPESFAAAVCELMRDGEKRRAIERRARAFVEQRYDWPAIGRRLLELYGVGAGDGDGEAAARARTAAAGVAPTAALPATAAARAARSA